MTLINILESEYVYIMWAFTLIFIDRWVSDFLNRWEKIRIQEEK